MRRLLVLALATAIAPAWAVAADDRLPERGDQRDFHVVHAFSAKDGTRPMRGQLLMGDGGWMYGVTLWDGIDDSRCGTVFRVRASGKFEVLHVFNGRHGHGCDPIGGLIRSRDGRMYGTTSYGGDGKGTIYAVSPKGKVTILHRLAGDGSEGNEPLDAPTEGPDGRLYGVITRGGQADSGVAYVISPTGDFQVLHHFGVDATGSFPGGSLTLGPDGLFYGVTASGGTKHGGAIFTLSPQGDVKVLRDLDWSDASSPESALLLGEDGKFYGTTSYGGQYGNGTVFSVTSQGELTVLASLSESTGRLPKGARLLETPDGRLVGTASSGGKKHGGTIFSVPKSGGAVTVHHSCAEYEQGRKNCTLPSSGLALSADGYLYGFSESGGGAGEEWYEAGTVYRLKLK